MTPTPQKVKTEGSRVQGQPELHNKIISKEKYYLMGIILDGTHIVVPSFRKTEKGDQSKFGLRSDSQTRQGDIDSLSQI